MKKYEVTLIKSINGRKPNQKATALALGLKRIGDKVVVEESESVRGQLIVIAHMVKVVEL